MTLPPASARDIQISSAYMQGEHLEQILAHLLKSLADAEAAMQKRHARKLKRRIGLCTAYLNLIRFCAPVISKYHAKPLYIINQFWTPYLSLDNLVSGYLPTVADFFSWYCDSNTSWEE
jgi:hypothetical protein